MGWHALLQGVFPTQMETASLTSPVLAGEFFTTSTTWEANQAVLFIYIYMKIIYIVILIIIIINYNNI